MVLSTQAPALENFQGTTGKFTDSGDCRLGF